MRPPYLWKARPCLVCGKDAIQTGQRPRIYCSRTCKRRAQRQRKVIVSPPRTCRVCGVVVGRKHQLCAEHLKNPPPRTSRPRRARCACGAPVPPERLRWCSEVCLVSHRVEQATDKQREQRQRQRVAA